MKNVIIFAIVLILYVSQAFSQLKVLTNGSIQCVGKLGINVAPSTYQMEMIGVFKVNSNSAMSHLLIDYQNGYYGPSIYPTNTNSCNIGLSNHAYKYIYSYNYPSPSDQRQKENIREIRNALDLVLKIRGVEYDLKKEYAYTDEMVTGPADLEKLEKDRKDIYGFIAQELNDVIPDVVEYDESRDVYSVNYMQVIPVLAEAIKEQNTKILELEKKIKDKNVKSSEVADPVSTSEASLSQNLPNPFSENTCIEYYLPQEVQEAVMYIYDFQGKQLNSINLEERDYGQVTISGSELKPGMYYYSLIADGKLIGTKQMVLTD